MVKNLKTISFFLAKELAQIGKDSEAVICYCLPALVFQGLVPLDMEAPFRHYA